MIHYEDRYIRISKHCIFSTVGFSRNYSMPERGYRDDKQPNFSANMTFGGGDGVNDNMNDTFNVAGQNKQSASKGAEVSDI